MEREGYHFPWWKVEICRSCNMTKRKWPGPEEAKKHLAQAALASSSMTGHAPSGFRWYNWLWLGIVATFGLSSIQLYYLRWYNWLWLGIVAVMVLAMTWPLMIRVLVMVAAAAAFGAMMAAASKKTGVWVSGYHPGITRLLAIGYVLFLIAIMFCVEHAHNSMGIQWAGPAGALLAVALGACFLQLWVRAYTRQL